MATVHPRTYELIVDADKGMGYQWTMWVAGNKVAGGYSKSMWQALDAANDALYDLFHAPLGAYYKSTIGS